MAPVEGGATVEQGALIADGHPSRVRAARWPQDMGQSGAPERVIKSKGGAKAELLWGCIH